MAMTREQAKQAGYTHLAVALTGRRKGKRFYVKYNPETGGLRGHGIDAVDRARGELSA